MPAIMTTEDNYYYIQTWKLTNEVNLLKGQLKVKEDEIKSLNASLAEAGARNALLELKISQIKKLLGINKED